MARNGAVTSVRSRADEAEDRFRYGWRFVWKVGPDGRKYQEEVPLTLEDVLYPREGDVIPEQPLHEQERGYLAGVFRTRRAGDATVVVLSDCIVNWGVKGVRNHSPDVSVFQDVRRPPNPRRGTFYVARSGGRPLLALELVSPEKRDNDVVCKFADYHRVRIPLYVLVDQETEDGPRALIGYRYTPQRYVRMRLDKQGRLLLKPLGVQLGLKDNRAICYDAQTDKAFGDYVQVSQALQAEAAARQAAETRANQLEEELRRLRSW